MTFHFIKGSFCEIIISVKPKTPEDLIPFTIALTHAEGQVAADDMAINYFEPFVGVAQAKLDFNDYVSCAIGAIGFNCLSMLTQSGLKTWSIPLMKAAFGTVASKMIGPIGVAITVISFGLCLYEADHH